VSVIIFSGGRYHINHSCIGLYSEKQKANRGTGTT
jgi:hypothetical protein